MGDNAVVTQGNHSIVHPTALQARRPPTGASPKFHGSPRSESKMCRASLAQRSVMTSSQLRQRSMSADLEPTQLGEAAMTYPISPSEQQVNMLSRCTMYSCKPAFIVSVHASATHVAKLWLSALHFAVLQLFWPNRNVTYD